MQNWIFVRALIGFLAVGAFVGHAQADTLPLKRGFYVSADVPCKSASYGSLSSYDGKGMTVGHAGCSLKVVGKEGNKYRVMAKCVSERDNSSFKQAETYTIISNTSYVLRNEFGEFANRYCDQSSLPWPWNGK